MPKRRGRNPHMHLGGAGLSQQADNPSAGGAANNRVIDHHHPLALDILSQYIQLDLHRVLTLTLGRLNKAAADVAVLDKSNTVRNAALLGIAQGGVQAAVRHADDNIRVYRVFLRQVRTGPHSGVLHRHALNHTVRPSKIDVLKHTNVA